MFKQETKIFSDKVRSLCIKDNYYTMGNNEQYENLLFNLCDESKSITLKQIEKIADDILQHSDWEKKAKSYGCDYDFLKICLMENLINECCYTFVYTE